MKTKKKIVPTQSEQLDIEIKKATLEEKKQLILSQRFKDRAESKRSIIDKLSILKNILVDSTVESDPDKPLSDSFLIKKLIEDEDSRQIIKDKIMDLIKKL